MVGKKEKWRAMGQRWIYMYVSIWYVSSVRYLFPLLTDWVMPCSQRSCSCMVLFISHIIFRCFSSDFSLLKSQNLTFYMQIIFVVRFRYRCCCFCCCHLYKNNKFCWVLNSCYEFMALWATYIGQRSVLQHFPCRQDEILYVERISLPNKQMFEFIMTVGRTCGGLYARSLVCVYSIWTDQFWMIICSMSKFKIVA